MKSINKFDLAKWRQFFLDFNMLIHWGRAMHICVSKMNTIGWVNALRLVGAKPLSEPMLEYC